MRLLLSGYRSYELSIFNDQDPKIKVIKYSLQQELLQLLFNGLEWVITGGQLGVEQWGAQVVLELKKEYPELKLGLMFPFADFGENWQENSQEKLFSLKQQADFLGNVSQMPYSNPQQLRNYQDFMLNHTDEALLVYDSQYPGKCEYLYRDILKKTDYRLSLIDMDQLQNQAQVYFESKNSWHFE